MDTTGAQSHDSGTTSFARIIPIRPGVDAPPRRVARVRARAARGGRAGARAAGWLRSPGTGRARRWTIGLLCAMALGLMWWDSRSEGYRGLPINTLGQVLGDLIMMGIALPLMLTRRPREEPGECGFSAEELADQIARATHRVQLLDAGSILFPESYGLSDEAVFGLGGRHRGGRGGRGGRGERPGLGGRVALADAAGFGDFGGVGGVSGVGEFGDNGDNGYNGEFEDLGGPARHGLRRIGAGHDARAARIALLGALRTALARDVTVEILLPRPGEMIPLDARTGLPARTIEQDLAKLRRAVPAGKLDIHHYREAPAMAMVRCDDQLWVSFPFADKVIGVADDDDTLMAELDFGGPAGRRGRVRSGTSDDSGDSGDSGERVYLRMDAHTRNARALALIFARLVAADTNSRVGSQRTVTAPEDRPERSSSAATARTTARTPAGRTPVTRPTGPIQPGGAIGAIGSTDPRTADAEPPRAQIVFPRQTSVRRPLSVSAASTARPGSHFLAPSRESAARREPAPFALITAPPGEEPDGAPRSERRWRPLGNRTRIRPDRDGE